VSTRITRDMKVLVEQVMHEEKLDRSAALRRLLSIGADEYRRRKALEKLQEGRASFGEAAEMAGMTVWEFRDLVRVRRVHWVARDVADDPARALGR
jgi:predicted HTH domain antitoxin